jgi:hypothetical protein
MVIDSNITTSGKTGNAEMIKLQRGDKIIERRRIDWEKNQKHFVARGFSLMEDKPKKKKSTKPKLVKV